MKLIKKLLIPGVALSVLFGFSYGLETSISQVLVNGGSFNFSDFCEITPGGSYYCELTNSQMSFNVSNNIISGIDLSKYSILNLKRNGSSCDIQLYDSSSLSGNPVYNRTTLCDITNNVLTPQGGYGVGVYFNCGGTYSACHDTYYVKYQLNNYTYVLDYKGSIFVDSGSIGITQSITNQIGQGTSQGFSSIVRLLIQILPWLIFLFIIGYVLRKILIRFGMLKSPGVALNSKTYNKGKK